MKKFNRGLTLIEMIVAISIFSIGIAGFSMLFLRVWKVNSFTLESGQIVLASSRSLNLMIKEIRKARQADNGNFTIKRAEDFDLTVYVDEDKDDVTEQVHYFLDSGAGELKKGVSNPSGSPAVYPEGDQVVTTLLTHVVNTDVQPVFSYFDVNYFGRQEEEPLSLPIVLPEVRLVKIHLWVNIKPQSAPDYLNLESFVELRNLNEN